MRADSFFCLSRAAGRLALLLLVVATLQGCKTETDSEDPSIIGVPPEDAYLGVEYSYNFGAVDKDDILNYSLTNAPTWLAMEDTTNKARQGIIIRGVPGISGGQRGREDLGRTTRINLVGNDRATSGVQPFSVDVQENQVSVVSRDYSEARPEEEEEGDENEEDEEEEERPAFQCEPPFMDARGEHTYTIDTYNDDGSFSRKKDITSETRPVLVQVTLDQPSVTRIQLAFELQSSYDVERCDDGFPLKHQRCHAGTANADLAAIGRDVVAVGSGSGTSLPGPEYIEYQTDADGNVTRGVLTLESGITECFVRLEVINDLEPENTEGFNFAFTEVRSGIAGLGPSNTGVREPLRIEDDEPTVRLQTLRGGQRNAVNLGSVTEYKAIIEGERDEIYYAKLAEQDGSEAELGTDFNLEYKNPDYDEVDNSSVPEWLAGDLIEFPVGTEEVRFRVIAQNLDDGVEDDRFVLLGLDKEFQSGRNSHAASDSDDDLRVSFNELTAPLQIGDGDGFVPSDMAIGQDGRLFIAGYDVASGNIPQVRVIDQTGTQQSQVELFPRGISLDAPPVIAFNARDIDGGAGNEDVVRYEFAVGFGVEEDNDSNATPGDINAVNQRWFFNTAQATPGYAQDWQLINGTSEDDIPRWVGIESASGNVLVAGVTRGVIQSTDAFSGGSGNGRFGSFVQRIDSQQDGADLEPKVAWARQARSPSHDERVVGGGIQNSSAIVVGDSSGAVEGESQFGGKDAFFYSAESADEDIDVQQTGTDADENLVDGFFDLGTVWLAGNSDSDYRITTEAGIKVLGREPTDSAAGFLLGYTPAGSAMEAYLVNDGDDQSTETLRAAMVFDGDLIAGGSTNGQLTDDAGVESNAMEDPALFRRNRQPRFEEDEDDNEENDGLEDEDKTIIEEPSQEWDQQIPLADPGSGTVERLANYRNDEVTALVREEEGGNTVWMLKLFTAEGDPLNPNP